MSSEFQTSERTKTRAIARDEVALPTGPEHPRGPLGRFKWPVYSLLVAISVILLWWAITAIELVHPIILPPPPDVGQALIELVVWERFPYHLGITLFEVFAGFALGSAIGVTLGTILALVPAARAILYPYIIGFQALPKVALAPLFVTWFGFGLESKIVMAIVICFFPVVVNTFVGLTAVDEHAYKLMRSLTATRYQIFKKLRLPGALPLIMAGLKTALTFAVIGAIVGEFIGGSAGLGYLINIFNFQQRIPTVYAVIIFLGLLSTALYLLIDRIERKFIFWADREDQL
jgi:NitT/TauT family transport system permease protein